MNIYKKGVMMQTKVMFLCGYISVYGGNFIPSLLAIDDRIVENGGIPCTFVFPKEARCRKWIKYMQDDGRDIRFIDFEHNTKKFLISLHKIIKETDTDIVHTHFIKLITSESIAISFKRVNVIAHIHSDFSQGESSIIARVKTYVTYHLLSSNITVITVSKHLAKKYKTKCTYIGNALAAKRIPCEHRTRKELRKLYNISDDACLIEIFGWSPQVKGVDIGVEAVKILVEAGYNIKLAIVCGREITTDKMKDYISSETKCNGSESFLLYWEPNEDVYGYHLAADILLSASRSEGFSYAILEMLSLGKRCVISDIPGTIWAKKYKSTVSFESGNAQSCANSIINALSLDAYYKEVSDGIRKQYAIDKWVDAIINIYNK